MKKLTLVIVMILAITLSAFFFMGCNGWNNGGNGDSSYVNGDTTYTNGNSDNDNGYANGNGNNGGGNNQSGGNGNNQNGGDNGGGNNNDLPTAPYLALFNPNVVSDPKQNGVFVLTNAGLESFALYMLSSNDLTDEETEYYLSQWLYDLEPNRPYMLLIMYDNILNGDFFDAVRLERHSNYYFGYRSYTNHKAQIFVSFDNYAGLKNVRIVDIDLIDDITWAFDLQFELDTTVTFNTAIPHPNDTPNITMESNSLGWWDIDFFTAMGSHVEIRRPDSQVFEQIENHYNLDGISLNALNLTQGQNVVRVRILGGVPFMDFETRTVYLSAHSLFAYHTIYISEVITAQFDAPSNFSLTATNLQFDASSDIHLYVRRAGQNDFVRIWESFHSLNLAQGMNTVRAVAMGTTLYDNGVLRVYTNSAPAYFDIIITSVVNSPLDKASNFRLTQQGVWWDSPLEQYSTSVQSQIFIRRADTQNFTRLQTHWTVFENLDLSIGVNTLRVVMRSNGTITLTNGILTHWSDSAPAYFDIIVTDTPTPVGSAYNLRVAEWNSDLITWDLPHGAWDNSRVYFQTAGTTDWELLENVWSIVNLENLDLAQGTNRLRVILNPSPYSDFGISGNMLLLNPLPSLPAYFDIVIN